MHHFVQQRSSATRIFTVTRSYTPINSNHNGSVNAASNVLNMICAAMVLPSAPIRVAIT